MQFTNAYSPTFSTESGIYIDLILLQFSKACHPISIMLSPKFIFLDFCKRKKHFYLVCSNLFPNQLQLRMCNPKTIFSQRHNTIANNNCFQVITISKCKILYAPYICTKVYISKVTTKAK